MVAGGIPSIFSISLIFIFATTYLYYELYSIVSEDLQKQHGLQFADNICSVIRRYKSEDDESHYYDVIEKYVKEVWFFSICSKL